MGDAPQTHFFPKALIFVFLFLALYTTLLALIPSEFYFYAVSGGRTYDPDEYSFLSMADVQKIRFLKNGSVTWFDMNADPSLTLNFNPDVNFVFDIYWNHWHAGITPRHRTWEFWFFGGSESMKIEMNNTQYGEALSKAELISAWDSNYNASIFYPVTCPSITVKVWVTDYNTTRNDIGEAWDDSEVNFAMGFGFDDFEAKQSAVDILGKLLLFQAPTLFGLSGGMGEIINIILTIPFYAMVGTLIFLVVIAVVPF